MTLTLDGTLGITSPAETVQGALTTTGNTILGDATTDTLNVGAGGLVKDASGNVGIGKTPTAGYILDAGIATVAGTVAGRIINTDTSATSAAYMFTTQGAQTTAIYSYGNGVSYAGAISNNAFALVTNNTERMRIDTSGNLLFNSGYGSVATAYGCRAWVNFNGTGTVAIRASGNVSSITDNGTGDYTVNFTTALVDANYCAVTTCSRTVEGGQQRVGNLAQILTTSYRFQTANGNGATPVDSDPVFVSVFR
jgi:hypothetical protein